MDYKLLLGKDNLQLVFVVFFLKALNSARHEEAMDICSYTAKALVYLSEMCSNQKDFMETLKFQEPFL